MKVANTITNKFIKKATGNFADGVSDCISYIDNKKFKNDIQQISDTVTDLLVTFDIFEKDNEVVGTDAMTQLSADLNLLHEMSNTLKPHMLGDVVPLFSGIQDSLKADDLRSSNGITFL